MSRFIVFVMNLGNHLSRFIGDAINLVNRKCLYFEMDGVSNNTYSSPTRAAVASLLLQHPGALLPKIFECLQFSTSSYNVFVQFLFVRT